MSAAIVIDLAGLDYARLDQSERSVLLFARGRAIVQIGWMREASARLLRDAVNREVARDGFPTPGLHWPSVTVAGPMLSEAWNWADDLDTLQLIWRARFSADDQIEVLLKGIGADLVSSMVEAISAGSAGGSRQGTLAAIEQQGPSRSIRPTGKIIADEAIRQLKSSEDA